MRVAVVGGRSRVDYLIETLRRDGHEVVAINDDRAYCEYLSNRHDVPVTWGNGTKRFVLEDAGIEGFDIIVAMTGSDADNLVICQLAQRFFHVGFQICMVSDPRNVEVFRRLGASAVISGTSMLTEVVQEVLLDAPARVGRPRPGSTGAMRQISDSADDGTRTWQGTSSFHRIGRR